MLVEPHSPGTGWSGTVLDVGVQMTALVNVIVCLTGASVGQSDKRVILMTSVLCSPLGSPSRVCLRVCSTLCLFKARLYFLNCVSMLRATGKASRTLFKASFFFSDPFHPLQSHLL